MTLIRSAVPAATENPLTLAVLGPPLLAFVVYGEPAAQGSKKAAGYRRGRGGRMVTVLVEQSKKVKPWRTAVAAAAATALPRAWTPIEGEVVMDLVVSRAQLARPGVGRRLPGTRPDLSKIARSVEDALHIDLPQIGFKPVFPDDSQVVSYRRLDKVYCCDPDSDSLRRPGAVIRVWRHPDARLGGRS